MDRDSETTHLFPTTSPPCETSDNVKYSEYKPSGAHNRHGSSRGLSAADLGICLICLDCLSRS
jgi:hypothetical protein